MNANTSPGEFYGALNELTLFFEKMDPTFTTFEDVLPSGRKKLIHSVGVVAGIEFKSSGTHPYTGLFKGADSGILRFSCAKEYSTDKPAIENFTPGMGVKFLRNGMYSGNFVAMYSVNGVPTWNPFGESFANHIPGASGALKFLAAKFATATDYVQTVGLSDFAKYDQEGNDVGTPVFPFKLQFLAGDEVAHKFGPNFTEDYKNELMSLAAGTTLYEVWAQPDPSSALEHIGSYVTTTKFTTSLYGDHVLFFQHQKMDDDLKY